jgi:small GTP-binding protein
MKVAVIGNLNAGKTSLCNECIKNSNNNNNSDKNFDSHSRIDLTFRENDVDYIFELCDIKSVEIYKVLDEMNSDKFSVVLICYSVMDLKSFDDVKRKWLPIVQKSSPNSRLMLVATKIDLRDDKVSLLRLDRLQNSKPITAEEGFAFSKNINATFHECSSFAHVNNHFLKEYFS